MRRKEKAVEEGNRRKERRKVEETEGNRRE